MGSSTDDLYTTSSSYDTASARNPIPKAFIQRRLHSITGVFLILFLIEHLLTNSQAALWIGEDGKGFIKAVEWIHSLPYLHVIEISLLLIPFLIHAVWGIFYIREAKINALPTDGSSPSFSTYSRNHGYTWQRLTALILAVGLLLHVVSMRFLRYPQESGSGFQKTYAAQVSPDDGLQHVAGRLHSAVVTEKNKKTLIEGLRDKQQKLLEISSTDDMAHISKIEAKKNIEKKEAFIQSLHPSGSRWYVLSDSFGVATLFTVRDVFKSPLACMLYTIFVLASCFHAGNGLWSAAIAWGVSVNERSRRLVRCMSYGLMSLLAAWGLASIWLTYFVTLNT